MAIFFQRFSGVVILCFLVVGCSKTPPTQTSNAKEQAEEAEIETKVESEEKLAKDLYQMMQLADQHNSAGEF